MAWVYESQAENLALTIEVVPSGESIQIQWPLAFSYNGFVLLAPTPLGSRTSFPFRRRVYFYFHSNFFVIVKTDRTFLRS